MSKNDNYGGRIRGKGEQIKKQRFVNDKRRKEGGGGEEVAKRGNEKHGHGPLYVITQAKGRR